MFTSRATSGEPTFPFVCWVTVWVGGLGYLLVGLSIFLVAGKIYYDGTGGLTELLISVLALAGAWNGVDFSLAVIHARTAEIRDALFFGWFSVKKWNRWIVSLFGFAICVAATLAQKWIFLGIAGLPLFGLGAVSLFMIIAFEREGRVRFP